MSPRYQNSPDVAGSLVPVVFSHNKHGYIPVFSSAGLIRKAQAIHQGLPQALTNLLSYVFVTSRTKQLIAFLFFNSPSTSGLLPLKTFPAESELTFRHLCLFSIAGYSVCVSGESVGSVLGLAVAAGDALRPGAGPSPSDDQAFLEAL